MKKNVELLRADIRAELAKLRILVSEFEALEPGLDRASATNYDKGAIGYYIHTFYTGLESIFSLISRFFENSLSGDAWHSDLLKRMKLEIPGYRPAVIDEKLWMDLNDFRGFRHIFRNAYSIDRERERHLGKRLGLTAKRSFASIEEFLSKLDTIGGSRL
jgi:hypothetical protein